VYVTVIHRIHDPEGFRAAEASALESGAPAGIALAVRSVSRDHRVGVRVWEGDSVTAVRDVVERVVGRFADTEYYETEVDGLAPSGS
jgi:hypothetical protein